MGKKRDPYRLEVGARLRALRLAQGFETIRSFAKALDLEEDRYDAWEKGKAMIPPHVVMDLRGRYGVTADWIYGGYADGLKVSLFNALRAAA